MASPSLPRSDDEMCAKVRDMIADIGVAIMVTTDAGGRMHGRPMRPQKPDAGSSTLWFFTRGDSPKVTELENDPRVLLSYSDPRTEEFISIIGTGTVVRDKDRNKALWTEDLSTWLPEGPEDDNVALIAVEMERAEYWDAASSVASFTLGYGQALPAGHAKRTADHARVSFQRH